MSRLKELYQKHTRTIIIIIAVILFCGLIYWLISDKRDGKPEPHDVYPIKESAQAVAIDDYYFYAVSNNTVTKYDRKNGKRILRQRLPYHHLKCAKMINGDLVLVDGHNKGNTMIWLNPFDLSPIDTMDMTFIQGKLAWIDHSWDMWWLCDVTRKVQETKIYCFDNDWNIKGFWKLPRKLLQELDPDRPFGGDWYGEYLCITGNQKPDLYVIDLPKEDTYVKMMNKFQVPFDGKGFILEQKGKKLYIWGVQDDPEAIVRGKITID